MKDQVFRRVLDRFSQHETGTDKIVASIIGLLRKN